MPGAIAIVVGVALALVLMLVGLVVLVRAALRFVDRLAEVGRTDLPERIATTAAQIEAASGRARAFGHALVRAREAVLALERSRERLGRATGLAVTLPNLVRLLLG
ncbi:MAG: hypothetical protein ACREM2_07750 [Vulcanimicrobiaceae bacterium]